MANYPLFPNSKPIDADVLVLCEGDAVDYETELLKRWSDSSSLQGRFVKVIACGTATAIYGVADAFGRTVPIIAVEDRDFRSPNDASDECDKKRKNREDRNVAMRGWLAWSRAEIENYFVDDDILLPVLSNMFNCTADKVQAITQLVIKELVVLQALEYALFRVRKEWDRTDANRALRVEATRWTPRGLHSYDKEEVYNNFMRRLEKWQNKLHDGTQWKPPIDGQRFERDFNNKFDEWSQMTYENQVWRRDWACKEVLKYVRLQLAASEVGWWSQWQKGQINWDALNDDKKQLDEYDRWLERQLQPHLVIATLDRVAEDSNRDLANDLKQLGNIIENS